MMHLEHLEQRSRIVWSKFWIQSYTFQWMLLLFLVLLSESIMTIMFLLHQHSAVLQIQVTSKNILYIRHFRFHFLCDSGWFNWAVEISIWSRWWVYCCHQLCSKQGRKMVFWVYNSLQFKNLHHLSLTWIVTIFFFSSNVAVYCLPVIMIHQSGHLSNHLSVCL